MRSNILLPNTTPEDATLVATRIGDRLRALQIPHYSSQVSKYVSLSCGVASTSKKLVTSPEDSIEQADLALYRAKERRDRAVFAD